MDCSSPGFPFPHYLPAQIHVHWVSDLSNHLILSCPFLLLLSIFTSIRVFSKESTLHLRWPKYWSFSISPFSEYSGLISLGIDWFGFLLRGRDSQESSATPQLKSIDFSALSLFCGPTLTFVYNSWKNHSFNSKCIMAFILATGIRLISVKWTAMHTKKQHPSWITTNRCMRWQETSQHENWSENEIVNNCQVFQTE